MEDTYLEVVKTSYIFNMDEVILIWDFPRGDYCKFTIRYYGFWQN